MCIQSCFKLNKNYCTNQLSDVVRGWRVGRWLVGKHHSSVQWGRGDFKTDLPEGFSFCIQTFKVKGGHEGIQLEQFQEFNIQKSCCCQPGKVRLLHLPQNRSWVQVTFLYFVNLKIYFLDFLFHLVFEFKKIHTGFYM